MRIFISYSSRYQDICDRLALALEANGRHKVFVDRSELMPGKPFDEALRNGIEDCDLLIFLLSPESVAPGSYALAELNIAKKRWRHPGGHVLPVKVAPIPIAGVPAYLRAVTILDPQGDVVAETVAAVDAIQPARRRKRLLAVSAGVAALAVALGVAALLQWQKREAAEAEMIEVSAAAGQLCNSGDYALGWQRYDEAIARYPGRPGLQQAREDCGMSWLRNIRVRDGKETFTDIVNRVLPVLVQGTVSATGRHAADLIAHLGWADFLRIREGASGLDPEMYYRKALAAEPSNVFGHAMWGHRIMATRGPIDNAKGHFAAAVATGRERVYVRRMQITAMLYNRDPAGQIEVARIAGEMRKGTEAIDPDLRERIWTDVYYDGLVSRGRREAFMSAARGEDATATFEWLYPENQVRPDRARLRRYLVASLEEAAGDRKAALAHFESLGEDLARERVSGQLRDDTISAIKRLKAR